MAKKTYIVKHPKIALRGDGEKTVTNREAGSEIVMDEEHAKSLVASGKLAEAETKKAKAKGKE